MPPDLISKRAVRLITVLEDKDNAEKVPAAKLIKVITISTFFCTYSLQFEFYS